MNSHLRYQQVSQEGIRWAKSVEVMPELIRVKFNSVDLELASSMLE